MKLGVIIEPTYRNSYWCTEILNGLKRRTYQRKILFTELWEDDLDKYDYVQFQNLILVVATSIDWINQTLATLHDHNLRILLAASDCPSCESNKTSCIRMNYHSSISLLMHHLQTLGDTHTALFGINPNSYADNVKKEAFGKSDDIYYNFGSAATCTLQFIKSINDYDSVICANDAVAIYLLHMLKDKNLYCSEKLHIVSFGDFFMSKLIRPTITSVSLDYYALGLQAVDTYQFLTRCDYTTSLSVMLDCKLHIRESTNRQTYTSTSTNVETLPRNMCVDFYNDNAIIPILSLEKLLINADPLDIKIIYLSIQNQSQEKNC